MGCKFSDVEGYCTIYSEDIDNPGWDENGCCICEDDPDPQELCEEYEPDN